MERPFIVLDKNDENLLTVEKNGGNTTLIIGESSQDASISLGGTAISQNGKDGISVQGAIKAGAPESSYDVVRKIELDTKLTNSNLTQEFFNSLY